MTIVPHDHRAHGSGRQYVAGMTVVLGESLFSSDIYCPLYPGVYRALLQAWQEYSTPWGWCLNIPASVLLTHPWAHPSTWVFVWRRGPGEL
jgi:hypothetical protein